MFEGLFMLLALSTIMAIASFIAGMLPLSFALSQSQLRFLTTLGMGVLVGTSLIVIIPEGIETLYSAGRTEKVAHARSLSARSGSYHAQINVPQIWSRASPDVANPFNLPGPVIPGSIGSQESVSGDPPKTPTEPGVIGILGSGGSGSEREQERETEQEKHGHEQEEENSPHAWIGIALISGFILMYLIDTLPQITPPKPSTRSNIYSLSDLSSSNTAAPSAAPTNKAGFSTTLGLLIHAFADGIALGASSSMPGLSFVVFFAIMIHKAPAAFGLTTVLLRQGLAKRQARSHLVAFSLAAPAGAVTTWLLASLLGGMSGYASGESGMKWWTGLILLFSGGTFLYVAMHTMQENEIANDEDANGSTNGYLGVNGRADGHHHHSGKNLTLIVAAIAGMLLPAITQIGHAHAH